VLAKSHEKYNKIINDILQGDLILGSHGNNYVIHKTFMGIQHDTGTHRNNYVIWHGNSFLEEVIWNNGWDFGDNIFIFMGLLHRCLVQIKSALGVPLSIQAFSMLEEGDT